MNIQHGQNIVLRVSGFQVDHDADSGVFKHLSVAVSICLSFHPTLQSSVTQVLEQNYAKVFLHRFVNQKKIYEKINDIVK